MVRSADVVYSYFFVLCTGQQEVGFEARRPTELDIVKSGWMGDGVPKGHVLGDKKIRVVNMSGEAQHTVE